MKPQQWLGWEDRRLEAEWSPGAAQKLAEDLGRTTSAINNRVTALGIAARYRESAKIGRITLALERLVWANG
jgi:hypothetical protein